MGRTENNQSEQVLHQFSDRLHPHHYLIIEIKEKLAQILGNFPPYSLLTLPRHLKERKIQLCQVNTLGFLLILRKKIETTETHLLAGHVGRHLQSGPGFHQDKRNHALGNE